MRKLRKRVRALKKKWNRNGFHMMRTLFCEGFDLEEVVLVMKMFGYRAYIEENMILDIPAMYVSEYPDEGSIMLYMIWWPKECLWGYMEGSK